MSIDLYKSESLPPMPKINLLSPGNITSKRFDSFPPIKTPKLQELNKEKITYPDLKTIKYTKPILIIPPPKKIIKSINKLKPAKVSKSKYFDHQKRYKYIAFILIKSLILCSVIYYILTSIIKD
jgi:hypothetical protein